MTNRVPQRASPRNQARIRARPRGARLRARGRRPPGLIGTHHRSPREPPGLNVASSSGDDEPRRARARTAEASESRGPPTREGIGDLNYKHPKSHGSKSPHLSVAYYTPPSRDRRNVDLMFARYRQNTRWVPAPCRISPTQSPPAPPGPYPRSNIEPPRRHRGRPRRGGGPGAWRPRR